MDNQTASKILELMAIDLTGLLAGLTKRNPMVDVIEQRIEAINTAKNALSDDYKDTLPHVRWEWFEEWNPSTPDHPRECEDCGWRCGKCKTALEDVVGGYWDDPDDEPKLKFCPNCGARMDGGA